MNTTILIALASMPYFLLILTTLFWSGNFVLSRGMHADIPPLALSFWRWLVALLILCSFSLGHLRRNQSLARQHWKYLSLQGLLGVTGFNSLIYLAMQSTTAINAVLVNSCIPVLIAVCSWLLYREKMLLRQVFGVGVSLCGVLWIVAKGQLSLLLAVNFNQGDILVFLAAICWALYSANLKRYPAGLHPFAYQTSIVIYGLSFLTPLYLLEVTSGKTLILSLPTVVTILYVAVFASILAFLFWSKAIQSVGANKAGPFIHLMPVFSTILAVIFLDERLQQYHLAGIALIFIGILLATFHVRQQPDGGRGRTAS